MSIETTSKHLIGATELTVIMPVRQGFVNVRNTITYATRLRFMLKILNDIRKASRESVIAPEYVGPIERLATINNARFGLLNSDTQLLLAVAFDQPWEPYIRKIWNGAGPILDAICSHCKDYTDNHRSDLGYENFAEWIRMNQVEMDFFFSAQPAMTTDDYRYLKKLESLLRSCPDSNEFDRKSTELHLQSPLEEAADALADSLFSKQPSPTKLARNERLIRQGLRAVKAMYRLLTFYPEDPQTDSEKREKRFWLATAQLVLQQFESKILLDNGAPLRIVYDEELKWFETVLDENPVKSRNELPEREPENLDDIQGDILTGYKDMSYGCILLVQVSDLQKARKFLENYADDITSDAKSSDIDKGINLAFTMQGLETMEVSESILKYFPNEFRVGMEQRAGMLGDIRKNHPDHWDLPDWNWPPHDKGNDKEENQETDKLLQDRMDRVKKVRLKTVDIVIEIQARLEDSNDEKYQFNTDPKFYSVGPHHPLYDEIKKLDHCETTGLRVLSAQPLRRKFKDKITEYEDHNGEPVKRRFVEEHFGYADGISQPRATCNPVGRDDVSYGELIRGYADDKGREGEVASAPKTDASELMKNGSFLVVRKLRQYVGHFNEIVDRESSKNNDIRKDELLAKLMGRKQDGSVLRAGDHIRDFDFGKDEKGKYCPFQAHIRRTNPRPLPKDGNNNTDRWSDVRRKVPRIMRRGFSYGPRYSEESDDTVDRGLFFMAYNASIAEQFEVIQRWISGGNSSGTLSAHDDPLLGVPPPIEQKRIMRFYHQGRVVRCNLGKHPFVGLCWGAYLFVPSISNLKKIANGEAAKKTEEPEKADEAAKGLTIIEELEKLNVYEEAVKNEKAVKNGEAEKNGEAASKWKTVLEDRSAKLGGVTSSVWAAIRKYRNGHLETPYGHLIGSYKGVMTAFQSPKGYSVREYWFRMRETIGAGFLGMDPEPQSITEEVDNETHEKNKEYCNAVHVGDYEDKSKCINKILYDQTEKDSYNVAKTAMDQTIKDFTIDGIADLKIIGTTVIQKMCHHWLGVPRHISKEMPLAFIYSGRYIFSSPVPRPFLKEQAIRRAKTQLEDIEKFVSSYQKKKNDAAKKNDGEDGLLFDDPGVISKQLFELDEYRDGKNDAELVKTIAGLSNGLIAPTLGSFLSVMIYLIGSEKLWRLQQDLIMQTVDREYSNVFPIVRPVIVDAMRHGPIPDIVHRVKTAEEFGDGSDDSRCAKSLNTAIKPGSRVVLSIESASHDDSEVHAPAGETDVLFGGQYDEKGKTGIHACPGARMGIGILVGMVTALLDAGALKPEKAPLTLSIDKPDEKAIP